MKKLLPILLTTIVTLTGCPLIEGEPMPVFYTQYEPVLMKRAEMEKAIRLEASREISRPAKIYVRGKYLFISEQYEGIHIVDNSDPRAPLNQAFIRIPGCVDMAVKGDILYADNATDLLALSISNLSEIKVESRIRNTFPVLLPPDLGEIPNTYRKRPDDMIIVGWNKTDYAE